MLVARKKFSLGDHILEEGDVVTQEMMDALPTGRLAQLVDHGWLDQRTELVEIEKMVVALEARVALLEAQSVEVNRPRLGRPPKIREEVGG